MLAGSWNLSPHAWSFSRASGEPSAHEAYWQPAVSYLRQHLTPSYRVEAVDTSGHWAAVYLPRAGIPLTRGWFRQDDFPQNEVLYDRLDGPTYLHWLRRLGVRYVVLTDAPTDYSAKEEARVIRSGRSGLARVLRTEHITIFAVPHPRPLLTGPAPAEVLALEQTHMLSASMRRAAIGSPSATRPTGASSEPASPAGTDGMVRLDHAQPRLLHAPFQGQRRPGAGDRGRQRPGRVRRATGPPSPRAVLVRKEGRRLERIELAPLSRG